MSIRSQPAGIFLLHPLAFVWSMWHQRALLFQLMWRQIQTENRGTFLGLFWSVLQPLLVFSIYGFVFVLMFQGRFGEAKNETSTQYAIGIFLGLNLIQLFTESLTSAPRALVSQPNFVKKIVFPLEILPISLVGASLFRTLIGIGLVFVALCCWGPLPNVLAFWMIPILIVVLLWSMGIAWILSALGVFIRDLGPLTQFLSIAITFFSAVFYSPNRITGIFAPLHFNPLLICLQEARNVLLWHHSPDLWSLELCALAGVILCVIAHAFFITVKGTFADCL